MAKVVKIKVQKSFKLNFDHSYSSCGDTQTRYIELAPGDNEAAVRKQHDKELTKIVVDNCVKFKKKHDIPKDK